MDSKGQKYWFELTDIEVFDGDKHMAALVKRYGIASVEGLIIPQEILRIEKGQVFL
ncbi:hypothetical protein Niako_5443 [Niastella koreensis GR20-10]|uniref:Uncharacterized protein n=1 Tax=Niastella koreensis (strain DSM 17620 / KACC 11465 / NBRC 106392 / GR20-10) TaxID=700598 RepID=G8TH68_NIAKG|nr:hypothetical protein [Niastella koreensis]AEW01678.1 hypothetical protein Niako_5443 [Niastella koreensis GR20-10]